ncbi:haloacid dehalogenase [Dendrothele bispora CBS 962.96]|uniref:Haloacid dehalogenase n=1 Tax=Dendrothele bispora (strain CBS 962.96) TaxID=1314807 RepID=A0A4S8MRN6_DENBC|nr:haloacid dehalogenase [Dendrothele bispora CBS 962.96]
MSPWYKALVFDLMGTCTDWASSIEGALVSVTSDHHRLESLRSLTIDWRRGFFEEIHRRFECGEPQEDIDFTHRRVLDRLLQQEKYARLAVELEEEGRKRLVQSWHHQNPWPDSVPGLQRLKQKFFIVVLANGTTRLQLDLVQSSGLPFHTLFSSQLLELTKPDPAIYLKVTSLLDVKPEECLMVAAHAYDVRAAATVGMKTAYIHRTTEDPDEDIASIETQQEFDLFIPGTDGTASCGLSRLADVLGA